MLEPQRPLSVIRLGLSLALIGFYLSGSSPAFAQGGAPSGRLERGGGAKLHWQPEWRRFSVGNYVLTGIAVTTAAAAYIVGPNEESPWRGENALDEWARSGLRADEGRVRQFAEDASDIGLGFSVSYPILVDALIVSAWYRDSPEVGAELGLITAESMAFTAALQVLSNLFTARERPLGRTCGGDIDAENSDCVDHNRYRSFFSGHTSLSFAAAAASCVHHTRLPIYGEEISPLLPCGAGFGVAGMTGLLRVASDYHYLSDVLVGALVGTGVGVATPLLLHYRKKSSRTSGDGGIHWQLAPAPGGLGVLGVF